MDSGMVLLLMLALDLLSLSLGAGCLAEALGSSLAPYFFSNSLSLISGSGFSPFAPLRK
jgi:hypothetical protein